MTQTVVSYELIRNCSYTLSILSTAQRARSILTRCTWVFQQSSM